MARSHKDGRRGGGHMTRECWSKRGSVTGTNNRLLNKECKRDTHRCERRLAKIELRHIIEENA